MNDRINKASAARRAHHPTPLRRFPDFEGIQSLVVKDESVQPNGTFKDRLSAVAVQRQTAPTTIACISYGNTAISLVRAAEGHALETGVAHAVAVVVPAGIEAWQLGPSSTGMTVRGERILSELHHKAHVVSFELASERLDDDALRALFRGLINDAAPFLNVTEGVDIPAYANIIEEAVEQLGAFPDVCVVPYGAGILCNEIRDFCSSRSHTAVVGVSVADPNSCARMLYGPLWLDVAALAREGVAMSRHPSPDRCGQVRIPYQVWGASESEVMEGLAIARRLGLSAEPSGSVGLGILHRLATIVPGFSAENHSVLVINTGNGIDGILRRGAGA